MFNSLMGGDGLDDLMGGQMRRMNDIMNTMLGPFGGAGDMFGQSQPSQSLMPFGNSMMGTNMMMPFGGLMNPANMFGAQNMSGPGNNSFQFSSSSMVMSSGRGPDGKPVVYQETTSSRMAPGGIRETKKTVCDSRIGKKKMAIERHIGDRAVIKEKEQDLASGAIEENEEFVNLDEEEVDDFTREFMRKRQNYRSPLAIDEARPAIPRSTVPAIAYTPSTSAKNTSSVAANARARSSAGTSGSAKRKSKEGRAKPYEKSKSGGKH